MKITDKNLYIDFLRGIAVFLVLWGHSIQRCSVNAFDFFENTVFKFIYSFHMPLFMLISGYLFYYSCKHYKFDQLVIYKTQSLLQPIVFGTLLHFAICILPFEILKGNFNLVFNGNLLKNIRDIWFLWSVLSCSIVVAFADFCCKNTYIKITAYLFGIVFVSMFPNPSHNIYMYPYFIIGFYFNKYNFKCYLNNYIFIIFSTLIFFCLLMFYNKECFIYISGLNGNVGFIRHMPIIYIDGQ